MWIFQILMMMMKVSIKDIDIHAAVVPLPKKYPVHVAPFLQIELSSSKT